LVIGEREPFYLEAGYEEKRGTELGEQYSRQYNERAIVTGYRSIINTITSPPAPFEDEIRAYFKVHWKRILSRAKEYAEGHDQTHLSAGFALAVKEVLPRLTAVFQSWTKV
jgi:hypothetical protein